MRPRAKSAAWLAPAMAFALLFASLSTAAQPAGRNDRAVIYLVRRGWHVDVGFAADQLAPPLAAVVGELPGAKYLFFGFGDRRYLMAPHRGMPVLLAALWPGRAVLLATGLRTTPAAAFGATHVIELEVSGEKSVAAQAFIRRSIETPDGRAADALSEPTPRAIAPGPYEGSLYFSAVVRYSALHTCNTWIAEVLRNAGLPVRSRGTLFAGQIWRRAQRLAAAERPGSGVRSD